MAKILLLGGTGALGNYLVDALAGTDHDIFVTSRSDHADYLNIHFIRGNARDNGRFLDSVLAEHFDCIVDFMVWNSRQFRATYRKLLENTGHYVYLSSYRVYADNGLSPLTEDSPLLLDVSTDEEYLGTDEYALAKAREERLLAESGRSNYTIVRPAITFSKTRFQLGTLEASVIIPRTAQHRPVLLPEEILSRRAAVSWAGDAGRMFAAILGNPRAMRETFNVATSESHDWRTIASYYREFIGTRVVTVPLTTYMHIVRNRYQVKYDRMFDRVIDNSKILHLMGLTQADVTPIKEALRRELADFDGLARSIRADEPLCRRMDEKLWRHHPLIGLRTALFSRRAKSGNVAAPAAEKTAAYAAGSVPSPIIAPFKKDYEAPGKIGLLDFSFSNSHGALLSSFALKRTVESLGYRTEIIGVKPEQSAAIPAFLSFRGRYLNPRSRRFEGMEDLKNSTGEWAQVITGAGPVWGPYQTDIRMLGWLSGRCRLISYAAGFGGPVYAGNIPPASARTLLGRFDALSVREPSAAQLCRASFGLSAETVLDPVFLRERSEYECLADAEPAELPQEPYVCTLFKSGAMRNALANNNFMLSLRSRYPLVNGCRLESGAVRSVSSWLSCIRHATYVVTDDFYGVALCCLFHRQFLFLDTGLPGEAFQVRELLDVLGIDTSRILPPGQEADVDAFRHAIPYKAVQETIERKKRLSEDFLAQALGGPVRIRPVCAVEQEKENGTLRTGLESRFESDLLEAWKKNRTACLNACNTPRREEPAPSSRHGNRKIYRLKYRTYRLMARLYHGEKKENYLEKYKKYKMLANQ